MKARRGEDFDEYDGQTYYGQPSLKPAPWDWTVSGYIYLAGLGGAAQILAAIGQVCDRALYRGVIRNARFLATTSSAIGAALLIADLRTPRRWYNMLRILRPTSPMSIGTYILGAFGGFSGLTMLGETVRGQGPIGRLASRAAEFCQFPAALTGAGAATYTASLMSATSTPYWAAVPRQLGATFATASVAAAAAALSLLERLAGRHESARRLDTVAIVATGAHLAASAAMHRRERAAGVAEEVSDTPAEWSVKTGDLLVAGALPLGAYALNRMTGGRSPALSILGSAAILAGGYIVRHGLLHAGRQSALRPRAGFRFAQPRNLPSDHRPALRSGEGHAGD